VEKRFDRQAEKKTPVSDGEKDAKKKKRETKRYMKQTRNTNFPRKGGPTGEEKVSGGGKEGKKHLDQAKEKKGGDRAFQKTSNASVTRGVDAGSGRNFGGLGEGRSLNGECGFKTKTVGQGEIKNFKRKGEKRKNASKQGTIQKNKEGGTRFWKGVNSD